MSRYRSPRWRPGAQTLALTVSLALALPFALPAAAQKKPAPAKKPAARPAPAAPAASEYVLYHRTPFVPRASSTAPTVGERLSSAGLGLFACKDETEPVTFAVYAKKPLKNATVTVASDFLSESRQSSLPRSAIQIHVVRSYATDPRLAQAEGASAPVTQELLVKDDREPIEEARVEGDPQTDVAASTSKQFWITVRVPRTQPVSTYRGRLLFSAQGVKPTAIPLTVDILPMRLLSPFLQYGMDLRSHLSERDAAPGEPVVTHDVFRRQLTNIREHGFRFVSLYDPMPALGDALKLYREAGMGETGPIVVMAPVRSRGDIEAIERLKPEVSTRSDFSFYYFTVLNGDTGRTSRDFAAIRQSSRSALPVALVTDQSVYETIMGSLPSGLKSDWVPVYDVNSDYARMLITTGQRKSPNRDWWTWEIAENTPVMNRLYAGFLLNRTGWNSSPLYGAFPGPYQEGVQGAPGFQGVAFTSRHGMIDTLQWEGTREGIDDIRYLTNLKTYIREVKDLKINKELTDEAEAFLAKSFARPLTTLSSGELQSIRRGMIDRSLTLLTVLRKRGARFE